MKTAAALLLTVTVVLTSFMAGCCGSSKVVRLPMPGSGSHVPYFSSIVVKSKAIFDDYMARRYPDGLPDFMIECKEWQIDFGEYNLVSYCFQMPSGGYRVENGRIRTEGSTATILLIVQAEGVVTDSVTDYHIAFKVRKGITKVGFVYQDPDGKERGGETLDI